MIINGVEENDDHYPLFPLESGKGRSTSAIIEKNQRKLTIKVPTEHSRDKSDNFGFPVGKI